MKKCLSAILALCMVLSIIPLSGLNAFAITSSNFEYTVLEDGMADCIFAGGDGSEENPYQVSTPEQLNAVRYDLSAHYIQINDIDMSDWGNWEPIGNSENAFLGSYNGNNYMINNLTFTNMYKDEYSDAYVGLFAELEENSLLKNIELNNININIQNDNISYGYVYCGGLVCNVWSNSEISNCIVNGKINLNTICKSTCYVGGVSGCFSSLGTIKDCINNVEIYVNSNECEVGGIVAERGNIQGCKNYGNIICVANESASCGGIAGEGTYTNLSKCYNYGNISVTSEKYTYCGGVSGETGKIDSCINYGIICGKATKIAGFSSRGGQCNCGGIIAVADYNVSNSINYGNVYSYVAQNEWYSSSYSAGIAGVVEDQREIINCYNFADEIKSSIENSNGYAGRISCMQWNKITNCYSINTTIVNGNIPTENIGPDKMNGGSLTKNELDSLIEKNKVTVDYGADRFCFGENIDGYLGSEINTLLVYKSPTENIASLEITSSNTDIVEIGTIKIGVGDYITSENEHIATVPLKLKAEGTSTITITSPEGVSESVTVTVSKPLEAKKSIAVFTTEKSLSVKTRDSMWLAFGLMNEDTGLVEEDWRKMAITVSDPTIISLSDYEETKYGYSLEVIGKKEGATNVTITDTETGLNTIIVINVHDSFVQTYSYAIDDMKVFYPNNQWEDHIATNIYNLNGIYVNNYQCIKNGNTYNIDFDVYNSRYYAGSVDIYDESGMWLGYEEINKYSDISSLWDTGEQAFYLISNTIALIPGGNDSNLLTYEQESFSKHTHISLQIPEGGYFTISNNVGTAPGTFFINAFEILFDGAYTALDLATSDSVKASALSGFKKSAAKSLADRLIEARNEGLKDEVKKKAQKVMLGTMQSEINKIAKKFSQAELKDQLTATDDICSEMANLAENILNSYNISWKHLFQSATGVGESFFTQFAGPAGVALKGCFAITKSTNKLLMATQMAASTPKPYVTVYSEIEKGYINPYGVIVNTAGNMDSEAVLQVFRVSNDDAVDVILDSNNPLEKHELYNICFVKDDQLVQPSGKVAVHIPIPEGMNSNTCKVYRQESDGSWTILDAHIEGNYLVFETDHFSLYSVIGDMDSLSIYSMPNKVVYSDGDTLDTDGLVLNLNGELISEGFICEPTVLSGVGNLKITVRYGNATTDFYVRVKALGGYTISGNAVSFGSQEENCVLCLIDKSGVIEEIEAVDGNYVFENIASGTYTLAVSKTNHVTRTYKITVANEDITQDVKIHLLGDINGDGKVNTIDVNRAYAHVRETNLLSGYELECANVAGTDETVNTVDINRIYAHVKGTKLLW